jgi:hypothetical protein
MILDKGWRACRWTANAMALGRWSGRPEGVDRSSAAEKAWQTKLRRNPHLCRQFYIEMTSARKSKFLFLLSLQYEHYLELLESLPSERQDAFLGNCANYTMLFSLKETREFTCIAYCNTNEGPCGSKAMAMHLFCAEHEKDDAADFMFCTDPPTYLTADGLLRVHGASREKDRKQNVRNGVIIAKKFPLKRPSLETYHTFNVPGALGLDKSSFKASPGYGLVVNQVGLKCTIGIEEGDVLIEANGKDLRDGKKMSSKKLMVEPLRKAANAGTTWKIKIARPRPLTADEARKMAVSQHFQ